MFFNNIAYLPVKSEGHPNIELLQSHVWNYILETVLFYPGYAIHINQEENDFQLFIPRN